MAELAASIAVDETRVKAVLALDQARAAAVKARSVQTADNLLEALAMAKEAVAVLDLYATGQSAKQSAGEAPEPTSDADASPALASETEAVA